MNDLCETIAMALGMILLSVGLGMGLWVVMDGERSRLWVHQSGVWAERGIDE